MKDYHLDVYMPDMDVITYQLDGTEITIEKRDNDRWAICRRGEVWARDGEWVYEPLPSSRNVEFIVRTRFTRQEAFSVARSIRDENL